MKRIITLFLVICLCVNAAFAFDPYADEELEKKSPAKLIYGIAMTLAGAFLAYDGFSQVETDLSRPSVDYITVSHVEWNQTGFDSEEQMYEYTFKSGHSAWPTPTIDQNVVYNSGNVDLKNIKIEVRYFNTNQAPIVVSFPPPRTGDQTTDAYGYRTVMTVIDLAKGESVNWTDTFAYYTAGSEMPAGTQRESSATDETGGLYRGEKTSAIMQIRIDLSNCYTKMMGKKNKSDFEGVSGLVIAGAGIYLLADYFVGLKKFDRYMKKKDVNVRFASYSNEYRLMLQKRL